MAGLQGENAHKEPGERADMAGHALSGSLLRKERQEAAPSLSRYCSLQTWQATPSLVEKRRSCADRVYRAFQKDMAGQDEPWQLSARPCVVVAALSTPRPQNVTDAFRRRQCRPGVAASS
jgi:hypothetical protein